MPLRDYLRRDPDDVERVHATFESQLDMDARDHLDDLRVFNSIRCCERLFGDALEAADWRPASPAQTRLATAGRWFLHAAANPAFETLDELDDAARAAMCAEVRKTRVRGGCFGRLDSRAFGPPESRPSP